MSAGMRSGLDSGRSGIGGQGAAPTVNRRGTVSQLNRWRNGSLSQIICRQKRRNAPDAAGCRRHIPALVTAILAAGGIVHHSQAALRHRHIARGSDHTRGKGRENDQECYAEKPSHADNILLPDIDVDAFRGLTRTARTSRAVPGGNVRLIITDLKPCPMHRERYWTSGFAAAGSARPAGETPRKAELRRVQTT